MLYTFGDDDTNTFNVLYPDGSTTVVKGKSIITTFPFERDRIGMEEIVNRLNLPEQLPAIERIKLFQMGRHIWDPIANFELNFELDTDYIEQSKIRMNSAMTLISRFNAQKHK